MKKLTTILLTFQLLPLFATDSINRAFIKHQDDPKAILSLLKSDEDPRAQAFLKRLEDFELDQVDSKRRRRVRRPVSASEVINDLNNDLFGVYLNQAKKELGNCATGKCLSKANGAWKIEDRAAKKHCYPGTNCNYYKCMEEQYSCAQAGYNYFSELAFPTCNSYVDRIGKGKFSQDGVEWIYTVMVCLQKGLFEECSIRGNCGQDSRAKKCEHIVDFTLEFHPGCYLESGIGVCNLSFKDQLAIWKTVGPYLTKRETVEAFKVVYQCLFK